MIAVAALDWIVVSVQFSVVKVHAALTGSTNNATASSDNMYSGFNLQKLCKNPEKRACTVHVSVCDPMLARFGMVIMCMKAMIDIKGCWWHGKRILQKLC